MNHPRPIRLLDAQNQSLVLEFSDSSIRRFDVTALLGYPFFSPLRNPALFAQAQIAHRTVVWPGDIDIAPETLWLDSVECPAD